MIVLHINSESQGKDEKRSTEDKQTPVRPPRLRISHQRNAPTSPAAPVPEAK